MAPFRASLIDGGWYSPNTYSVDFDEPPDGPGVYLILGVDFEREPMHEEPLYVGMSLRLARRLANHPVLAELRKIDRYVIQVWFKPMCLAKTALRKEETAAIQRFRPPYNIIGRVRGEEWASP